MVIVLRQAVFNSVCYHSAWLTNLDKLEAEIQFVWSQVILITFVMVMAVSAVHFCQIIISQLVADWSEILKPGLWLVHSPIPITGSR